MLYNSCVVKYSIVYSRAYGAFDAELCRPTTSWAPVLTNSKFGRVFVLIYGIFQGFIKAAKPTSHMVL